MYFSLNSYLGLMGFIYFFFFFLLVLMPHGNENVELCFLHCLKHVFLFLFLFFNGIQNEFML
jgi:hypothetical protein